MEWIPVGIPPWVVSDCLGTGFPNEYHDLYIRCLFTRSIVDFLLILYSSGSVYVPNGSLRHRKASFFHNRYAC